MMNSDYHRKRRRARRKRFLAMLGGICENCGSRRNLQFDHINPSKKHFGVSRYINSPEKFVKKEIDKCRLLCEKCHKEKTHNSWDYALPPAEHGSLWMYKHYKCRCDKCRKAMSDYYYHQSKKRQSC